MFGLWDVRKDGWQGADRYPQARCTYAFTMKKRASVPRGSRVKKQSFPRGWNERRVKELIAYYDRQTEEEELVEYESAMEVEGQSVLLVPTKLVPEIRRLINRLG